MDKASEIGLYPRDIPTAKVAGIGPDGIAKLRCARVIVVGAGGLAAPILAYLVAAGVGSAPSGVLGVADDDTVAQSNLGRQVLFPHHSVGEPKTQRAIQTLRLLNPQVNLVSRPRLGGMECPWEELANWQLVVDATDSFESKFGLARHCHRLDLPLVWGSVVGSVYQVSVFANGYTLTDIFPHPPSGATDSADTSGVLGPVVGQAGTIMATEVIKYLTGMGQPLIGRLLSGDGGSGRWDIVNFHQRRGGHAQS